MQKLTLKAPAKINLYLNVLNKRPDGFHNIETIFEKVDLCDRITLRIRRRGIKIYCRQKEVPCDKRNLCFKAAQMLLERFNCPYGVTIKIVKRIPVAAGLGGGSSDAASVLLGLNRLFHLRLGQDELLQMASALGADVPLFILPDSRALGRGKGEILTPLELKGKNWYVLVVPKALSVSTRRMYQHPRITLTKRPSSVKIVLHTLEKGDLTSLEKYSYNSFEGIIQKKYKQVLDIKKALKSFGAQASLMSGSGPCVFGIIKRRKEAIGIRGKLRVKHKQWRVVVTRTYDNSRNMKED